jgi:hypothetical protein
MGMTEEELVQVHAVLDAKRLTMANQARTIANDMKLHKIEYIEQTFLQTETLDEGVNGRYFINPPPGSPETGNKKIV